MSTNELYIPKPIRKPVRFVVHTPRSRIICMSTSGLGDRSSALTQTAAITTASTIRPITRAESHPHVGASLIARSRQISQSESRMAPVQLTVPGARIGDSGITMTVAIVVRTMRASGIQNSQW